MSLGHDLGPAFEQGENNTGQDKDDAMDNAQVNVVHSHDHAALGLMTFLSDFCICQKKLTTLHFPFVLVSFKTEKSGIKSRNLSLTFRVRLFITFLKLF